MALESATFYRIKVLTTQLRHCKPLPRLFVVGFTRPELAVYNIRENYIQYVQEIPASRGFNSCGFLTNMILEVTRKNPLRGFCLAPPEGR